MDGQPIDEDARAPLPDKATIVPACAPVQIEDTDITVFSNGSHMLYKKTLPVCRSKFKYPCS